ncbi:MAG TPA: hypothetical protein VLF62_04825 [Candidatus Saccharimonadales bacterium]|jgi:hypothetical protein|nr:hypothetical protein [Candidatus Saccharimonadales bacterium]
MVLKQAAGAHTKQRKGINKLTLGFASLAAAAVIGTTGVAAAQTGQQNTSGGGYGNTTNVELNVHQSGSNNVLNIIMNIFQ